MRKFKQIVRNVGVVLGILFTGVIVAWMLCFIFGFTNNYFQKKAAAKLYDSAMYGKQRTSFYAPTSKNVSIAHLMDVIQVDKTSTTTIDFNFPTVTISSMKVKRDKQPKQSTTNGVYGVEAKPNGEAESLTLTISEDDFGRIFKQKFAQSHDVDSAIVQTLNSSDLNVEKSQLNKTNYVSNRSSFFARSSILVRDNNRFWGLFMWPNPQHDWNFHNDDDLMTRMGMPSQPNGYAHSETDLLVSQIYENLNVSDKHSADLSSSAFFKYQNTNENDHYTSVPVVQMPLK